jgi:hypothetical protein
MNINQYSTEQLEAHWTKLAALRTEIYQGLSLDLLHLLTPDEARAALGCALAAIATEIAARQAATVVPDPLPHPQKWDAPRLPLDPPAAKQAAFAEQATDLARAEQSAHDDQALAELGL